MSIKDRVQTRLDQVRKRRPFVDHLIRMVGHYGNVHGSQQAGAVTFFGFLSFFPILALGFAVVGFLPRIYEGAHFETDLVDAINSVLPGLVTQDPDQSDKLYLPDIQDAAPSILSIGLPILLYTGLGWLSAMREGLVVVFQEPKGELPNFVIGKLRDLASLATIGLTLVVAVAVAGLVKGFSDDILGSMGLGDSVVAEVLLWALTVVVGLAANSLLFFSLFKLLAGPSLPNRALWSGALLGAVGFEALKQLSTYLLASTQSSPATQAFGIALILVVWINYFSRVVLYAGAWAYTSPASLEQRERAIRQNAKLDAALATDEPRRTAADESIQPGAAFALGGAAMLGAVALVRKTIRKSAG